jgi:copper homeostasis protein
MIRFVKESIRIPVFVMIRPRGGDCCYSAAERSVMRYDIQRAIGLGVDGFVFGLMKENKTIDTKHTMDLVKLCNGKPVTFHRAFDTCYDPFAALEQLIGCGVQRILSSGQKSSAEEGAGLLSDLTQQAAGRIIVLPGAGINPANIRSIAEKTGCTEFHASAKRFTAGGNAFGFGEHILPHPELVAAMKKELE